MKIILLAFLVMGLVCSFVYADTNISSCQTLAASGVYDINASFTANVSPCINITNLGVWINGLGNSITGISSTAPIYVINVSAASNDSIFNLTLIGGTNSAGGSQGTNSYALLVSGSNGAYYNDTITGANNTGVNFGGTGLSISGSNNTFYNDTIRGGSTTSGALGGFGVIVSAGTGNLLTNLSIFGGDTSGGGQGGEGVQLSGGSGNTFSHDQIDTGDLASGIPNYDANSLTGTGTFFDDAFNGTVNGPHDTAGSTWNTTINCAVKNIIGGKCQGGNYEAVYHGFTYGSGIGTTSYAIGGGSGTDLAPLTNNLSSNNITACGNITTIGPETFQFNQTITYNLTSGYCIFFNGSNILLNGNNFLFYNNATSLSANAYGVSENGQTNITLTSMNASNNALQGGFNIYFVNGFNNTLKNSYLVNGSNFTGGVFYSAETNASFTNNSCFTPVGQEVNSCVEFSSVNGGIINLNLLNNSASHNGIYVLNSNNTLIDRNSLYNMSSSFSGHGIRMSGGVNNTIRNNFVNKANNTAFLLENNPANLTVINNSALKANDGFDFTTTGYLIFLNNTAQNNTRIDYRFLQTNDALACANVTWDNSNIATGGGVWSFANSLNNNQVIGNITIPGAIFCNANNITLQNVTFTNGLGIQNNEIQVLGSTNISMNQVNASNAYTGILASADASTDNCSITISNSHFDTTNIGGVQTNNCTAILTNITASNSAGGGLLPETGGSFSGTNITAVNNTYGIETYFNTNVSVTNSTLYGSTNSIINFFNTKSNNFTFTLSNTEIGNDSNMDKNANITLNLTAQQNDAFNINYPFFPLSTPALGLAWDTNSYANFTITGGSPILSSFGFTYLNSQVNPPAPQILGMESLASGVWSIDPTTLVLSSNLYYTNTSFNTTEIFTAGIQQVTFNSPTPPSGSQVYISPIIIAVNSSIGMTGCTFTINSVNFTGNLTNSTYCSYNLTPSNGITYYVNGFGNISTIQVMTPSSIYFTYYIPSSGGGGGYTDNPVSPGTPATPMESPNYTISPTLIPPVAPVSISEPEATPSGPPLSLSEPTNISNITNSTSINVVGQVQSQATTIAEGVIVLIVLYLLYIKFV